MMPRFAQGPVSPLPGVNGAGWRAWMSAMEVQPAGAVSKSGGLGAFDMRPRRLVELKYATGLRRDPGTTVQHCVFILPWTESRFLSDWTAQYAALAKSTRLYYDALRLGEIKRPDDVSISGALAILHIGGVRALKDWPDLFENTRALYEAARGAF